MIVVAGTGTDVGKTFVTCALLAALRRSGVSVGAWKPVASGGGEERRSPDSEAHAAALQHEVSPPLYAFRPPISPHLAARQEGCVIDLDAIVHRAHELATEHEVFLLETAGGLFSPLSDTATNADLVRRLGGALIVVAPDRLGVLHDVGALARAAHAEELVISTIVLSSPETLDASTGSNAVEIERTTGLQVGAVFPRGEVADPVLEPVCQRLFRQLVG